MNYKPMTQEDFDYQHSEIIEWYKLWDRLFWVGVVFFVITLIVDNLLLSAITIAMQSLFVIFQFICRSKHNKLHDKWERQNGE